MSAALAPRHGAPSLPARLRAFVLGPPRSAHPPRRVLEAIRRDGIATLVVDRDYRKVAARSDRLLVLQKGQVVLTGSASALRHGDALASYLGL